MPDNFVIAIDSGKGGTGKIIVDVLNEYKNQFSRVYEYLESVKEKLDESR